MFCLSKQYDIYARYPFPMAPFQHKILFLKPNEIQSLCTKKYYNKFGFENLTVQPKLIQISRPYACRSMKNLNYFLN